MAETAVVFGELAKVGLFAGRQGLETGFTVLGPTQYGLCVRLAVVGGAMASGFSAAGFQFIDGALGELAKGEQFIRQTFDSRRDEQAVSGASGWRGLGKRPRTVSSSVCYI